jgi:hypothetical protein
MRKTQVRRTLAAIAGACAVFLCTVKISADGLPVDTDLGDEYEMMQNGTWPSEVTFADTVFTNEHFAVSSSVLTKLNGQPAEEHSFTVKAGDRVDFTLKGSDYPALNYYESLISWNGAGQFSVYGAGFGSEGVYVFDRDRNSYQLEVTDFGFESSLGDLTAHAVMTLDIPAVRVMSEEEYLGYDGSALYGVFSDAFKNAKSSRPHPDTIHVRAEGDAVISPYNGGGAYNYLGGVGDSLSTPSESDSVGFSFIFSEGTQFEIALNDGEYRALTAYPRYSALLAQEPEYASWENTKDQELIRYVTPAIVLIDSDLVERDSTVLDEWNNKNKPEEKEEKAEEQPETAEPEQPETESETAPESSSGSALSPITLIGALAVIAAAAGVFFMKMKK